MTYENRTADDIERDIQMERAQMTDSINTLQQKFSVETIVGDLGSMLRTQGGDLGRVVAQTVGRNPAAVVMVGVGLAWLVLGQNRGAATATSDDQWRDQARKTTPRAPYQGWDSRTGPLGSQNPGDPVERDQYWYGTDKVANRASGAGNSMMATVQDAAHAVGDAMSDAADSVGQSASDLTARLSHGLEDFTEEARSRIVAARRAAHDARVASANAMKDSAQMATSFFDHQPLVVAALAMAAGAAMGGILPHSKLEDDTMGDSSNQLFADAQALFRDERAKVMSAVRGAVSDVKTEVSDAAHAIGDLAPEGKSVGEAIVDRAADAATRVFDRATDDAFGRNADRSDT